MLSSRKSPNLKVSLTSMILRSTTMTTSNLIRLIHRTLIGLSLVLRSIIKRMGTEIRANMGNMARSMISMDGLMSTRKTRKVTCGNCTLADASLLVLMHLRWSFEAFLKSGWTPNSLGLGQDFYMEGN